MRRYWALVGGRERRLEVQHLEGSRFRVSVDGGAPREVEALRGTATGLGALVGTAHVEAGVEEDGETLRLDRCGESSVVELLDDRTHLLRTTSVAAHHAGPVAVCAPMPGKVVKLLVGAGDAVHDGQGLVVIEAMKMENELRAPRAGRVSDLRVREGQAVEGREKLLVLE